VVSPYTIVTLWEFGYEALRSNAVEHSLPPARSRGPVRRASEAPLPTMMIVLAVLMTLLGPSSSPDRPWRLLRSLSPASSVLPSGAIGIFRLRPSRWAGSTVRSAGLPRPVPLPMLRGRCPAPPLTRRLPTLASRVLRRPQAFVNGDPAGGARRLTDIGRSGGRHAGVVTGKTIVFDTLKVSRAYASASETPAPAARPNDHEEETMDAGRALHRVGLRVAPRRSR
jgi:hypothetical protein